MQVPDSEGLANYAGPESCVPLGNGRYEALTGEGAGRVWSPEIAQSGGRRAPNTRKATAGAPSWQGVHAPGGVGDLWHAQKHCVRNPGDPASDLTSYRQARTVNPRGTTVMDGWRESDSPIVSAKLPNKGAGAPGSAEGVERRGLAKGNLVEHHKGRTQRRETLPQARD